MQSEVLDQALADVKVWRSGYVMLVTGISAILALIGTQLDGTVAWYWRMALTITLGTSVVLVARALALTLRIEGGKSATTINAPQVVSQYNSFEMYRAERAAIALEQLDRSKRWAGWGALFCVVGLVCTLWMTSTAATGDTPRPSSPISTTTSTPKAT